MTSLTEQLPDVASLLNTLDAEDYLADPPLGTAMFLAARMGQPLLLEGEPGVGKTEAAKALAGAIDTPLIRLQCYEGLTSAEALYEWNYPRQLLAIRLAEARHETPHEADLFGPDYLLARPLLAAIERCLYHWIDYPGIDRVAAIIRRRVPGAAEPLAGQVARGVARLRGLDLAKPPGVAEAISWTAALHMLGAEKLDEETAEQTAGAVLKYAEDLQLVRETGFGALVTGDD